MTRLLSLLMVPKAAILVLEPFTQDANINVRNNAQAALSRIRVEKK